MVFSKTYIVGLIMVHPNLTESTGNMSEEDFGIWPRIPSSFEKYTHPKGHQQIAKANIIRY